MRLCGVRAVLRQESPGHSEEDDEGEGEEPGAASASALSDEDCEGDDERHAMLLSHDGHSLEELKFGRDHAVRPAGHEERRRERVHAFTRNEGDLRAG